jgi:hypothetical protein
MGRRTLSKVEALSMRAARAHEDPVAMTTDAILTRLARYVARVLKQNPELTEAQAANAARLLLRADMTAMAEKREAARRAARQDRGKTPEIDPPVSWNGRPGSED